jgi:DHA1 family inner membrane transport protein
MSAFDPRLGATPTGRIAAISVAVLAFSAFLIVTTEFLIVGLLPALSQDLGVSISMAGQLVTLFAFTVMLAGPFLTAALAHLDRKRLFITILLVFAAANALAAASTSFWVLAIARVVPALALPVFWGTASETAGQLAGPDKAGQAISKVYLGISAAMLLGIPLGTVASNAVGWRGAFWILAALSLLMALAMWVWMPHVARAAKVDFMQQARIFKERYFLANVLLSVVVFTAMFTGYSYLAELLQRVAGVPPAHTGWWLMGFGAVGLLGNWIGGRVVDRSPLRATALFLLLLAIGMAAIVPLAHAGLVFCLALGVWGVANTALYPISQVRVMGSVTHAQALAGSTNVSAANAGIGLGAVLGGLTIPGLGIEYLGYVAAGVAVVALGLVPLVGGLAHQRASLARVP